MSNVNERPGYRTHTRPPRRAPDSPSSDTPLAETTRALLLHDLAFNIDHEEKESRRLFTTFDMDVEMDLGHPEKPGIVDSANHLPPMAPSTPPPPPNLSVAFRELWASITSSPPPAHLLHSRMKLASLVEPPDDTSDDVQTADALHTVHTCTISTNGDSWRTKEGTGNMHDITYLLAINDHRPEPSSTGDPSAYSLSPLSSSMTLLPSTDERLAKTAFPSHSAHCLALAPLSTSSSLSSVSIPSASNSMAFSNTLTSSQSTPHLSQPRSRWTSAFDSPYEYPLSSNCLRKLDCTQDAELFEEFFDVLMEKAVEMEEQATQLEISAGRLRRLAQLRRHLASKAQQRSA